MGDMGITSASSLLIGVFATCLYVMYRAILPHPLPGIPYNEDAANKAFGDVPEMMGYVLRTKRIFVSPGLLIKASADEAPKVLAHFTHYSAWQPHHPGFH
jgi:hypothetical protein